MKKEPRRDNGPFSLKVMSWPRARLAGTLPQPLASTRVTPAGVSSALWEPGANLLSLYLNYLNIYFYLMCFITRKYVHHVCV